MNIHYDPANPVEFKAEPVVWTTEETKQANSLKAARYAMHKVRHANYANAVLAGQMTPDLAKQYYLAAMKNYDDMMKAAEGGAFNDAIDEEMAAFDVNEAFHG